MPMWSTPEKATKYRRLHLIKSTAGTFETVQWCFYDFFWKRMLAIRSTRKKLCPNPAHFLEYRIRFIYTIK